MEANRSGRTKKSALFWIMRPPNSFTAAMAVNLAIVLTGQTLSLLAHIFMGTAAYFTTSQANTHNDLMDIEVDRINSPERPLPSGILTPDQVKIWIVIQFILAMLSGLLIDFQIGFLFGFFPFSLFWAIINSSILDLYNWKLKKSGLLGNFVVGYVVGALFFYADIIIYQTFTFISFVGLFAMLMLSGREVIKTIRDIEGDRRAGINTIAVNKGARAAAIVATTILGFAILSSIPIIIHFFEVQMYFISFVLIFYDCIMIFRSLLIVHDPNPVSATKFKKFHLNSLLIIIVAVIINILLAN
ncbi:MAG: geranylgeranylglycerol-phosphate geranylgeranyltransferase [Candidatus Heimdallarchaeota archaeon]|nr:geranylgeranylglycerol-phosphate geranylgeranyltransferase [Candidatus Heimdallarchaeota archaeon]